MICRNTVHLALAFNLLLGSASAQGQVLDLPDLNGVKLGAKVSMESEPGVLRFESVPLTAEARALLAINGRFVLAQISNSPAHAFLVPYRFIARSTDTTITK